MTTLPKPLVMSDTEILDFIENEVKIIDHYPQEDTWVFNIYSDATIEGNDIRKIVCQAAAIKQQEGKK